MCSFSDFSLFLPIPGLYSVEETQAKVTKIEQSVSRQTTQKGVSQSNYGRRKEEKKEKRDGRRKEKGEWWGEKKRVEEGKKKKVRSGLTSQFSLAREQLSTHGNFDFGHRREFFYDFILKDLRLHVTVLFELFRVFNYMILSVL
jgi:CelD/BcsL family acetyltransferase involved in cellulose biosynthesis